MTASPPNPIRLVLFFTRGVSLATWADTGLISREVVLYLRLALRGVEVTFITHGGRRDLELARDLPGIRVLCNRWGLPGRVYHKLMPLLHRRALAQASIIKTQQILGSEFAVDAARRFGKPLIARSGWLWSRNAALEHGPDSPEARRACEAEAIAFGAATRVVLTTDEMREEVAGRYPGVGDKITVIPNYIDTDTFRPPVKRVREPRRVGFVGRFSKEKNLEALIDAVRDLDVDLDLIGQGPHEADLRARAASNPRVRFAGTFPNDELPHQLAKWSIFVFPSLFEGHPKALLEAMACGVPVITTDVPGNRTIVTHGRNGVLCAPDTNSLRAALEGLLADPEQQERLGRAGRQHVVDRYSLEGVLGRELGLYEQILSASAAHG